jgi:hypothetical protein
LHATIFGRQSLGCLIILARASKLEVTTLAVGCWHILNARNDAQNNQTEPQPQQMSTRIFAYIQMILQHYLVINLAACSDKPQKWPPPGEILVNVDTALFPDR